MKKEIVLISLILLVFASCTIKNTKPTFSKDIAPIIYKHCTSCHSPNQIGHFNLVTYNDIKVNADKIQYCVKNKIMPPWPADPTYTSFINENVLSEDEIEMIDAWVNNNFPIGDSTKIPTPPTFQISLLGKPDTQLMVKPMKLKGDYKDQFLIVKVPLELDTERFIQTVEFVPGNTKIVHHVNGDIIKFDVHKKKNIYDGEGVSNIKNDSTIKMVYQKIGALHDDGTYPTLKRSVVNYLPGVQAVKYPEGIGGFKANKKNAFLLNDLHYGPSVDDTWDSSYINIFFAKTKPKRNIEEFQLGTLGVSPIEPPLVIPPNEIKTYKTQYTLDRKIAILTVNPHMHLLGKTFKAYALSPKQDTIRLINIPKWDFNWQFFYTYKHPVILEKGSTIIVEGVFDNTDNNPFNPNTPPKEVRDNNGSMRTTDEMFQFIITYLNYEMGDENIDLNENSSTK